MKRTQMQRKPSKLKRTPLGHASPEQKAKVEREGGTRISFLPRFGEVDAIEYVAMPFVDAAHITPRAVGGCDAEECVIPLLRHQHQAYDRDELDILPYLTLEEQAHAVSHLGILGALKRTTGETYVPEPAIDPQGLAGTDCDYDYGAESA